MGDFSELSIRGRVATPSDTDWKEARQAWNLAADQQPAAVTFVESADDVSKTVAFAGENGLRVTGQGTGHGAVAMGSLEDTILIKTERMQAVEVADGTARMEAGVLAEQIGGAAHEKGMSFLPGTSPNVGVTGYTLGGGLSWLGRKYGWACNNVTSMEVVTADGEARTVDSGSEPDLFWALRGGGGGFAIVTALHVNLFPVAEVYAGGLLFSPDVTEAGLRRYRDWTAEVPRGGREHGPHAEPPPDPRYPRGDPWEEVACDHRLLHRRQGGGGEAGRTAPGDR